MGERGPLRAELEKLIDLLKANRPNVVCLPNLMFIGIAERLKASLGVPAVCTLSGEDVFLDALAEPFRRDAWSLIREAAPAVDAFLAVTNDYADHAAARFRLPRDRIHVVPLGVRVEDFSEATPPGAPFTIGYLARICPPKGLAVLAEAFVRLRRSGRDVRLRVAGYVSRTDRPYLRMVRRRLRRAGMLRDVDFVGEVNREEKARFLRSLHVLSVPAVYREAKGLYVLEALACGVPVVQPRHGSFPELVEGTGGGLLYDPAEPGGPAEGIARLMDDPSLHERLARQGRAGLIAHHTDRLMAERTWKLLESVHARAP
jgi:glycosyltransferase involved in cell wall biosynthesis